MQRQFRDSNYNNYVLNSMKGKILGKLNYIILKINNYSAVNLTIFSVIITQK